MASLFKKPKVHQPKIEMPKLPKPKPVRMPTEIDPVILEAQKRTREAALKRRGRLSTLLTDHIGGEVLG
jgi:hypothetical protein